MNDKENKIIKAANEKQHIIFQRITLKIINFSTETLEATIQCDDITL